MSDAPAKEVVSTRLDPLIVRAIDKIAKRDGVTRSDIIAECVRRQFSTARSYTNISVSKEKRHGTMNQEDYDLVQLYKEVFNYKGRIFYPAVKSTIQARRKDGLSQMELEHCIRVAPQDDWIKQRLATSKQVPPINEILGPKMVSRLLQTAEEVAEETEEKSATLEQYKRTVIDIIWNKIPPGEQDKVREALLESDSYEEVNSIATPYRS